jgi:hypothetical protein
MPHRHRRCLIPARRSPGARPCRLGPGRYGDGVTTCGRSGLAWSPVRAMMIRPGSPRTPKLARRPGSACYGPAWGFGRIISPGRAEVDRRGDDDRAEQIGQQGMAQSGRPDLRGGEAGVGDLEGHPDREGEVGEVGVLRAPVLDREVPSARVSAATSWATCRERQSRRRLGFPDPPAT